MFSRAVILTAVVAYALVLGCVLSGGSARAEKAEEAGSSGAGTALAVSSTPGAHGSVTARAILPLRGCGMQIQRVDWIDKYKQSMDEIAAIGADSVLLVIDTRMENGTSSRIYLDMRMTPTPDQLGDLIDHAKKLHLKVILMPIVLLDSPRGNEWRGTLKPESWDEWFESYRDMMVHFSWIAEAHHVDVLVIGSELVSAENKVEEWNATIRRVRGVFHGLITYSSNWDHYTSVPFWKKLDLIGMNSYWKLGENRDVTVAEIQQRWGEIQRDLMSFQKRVGKPLLFLEAGWCSLANAASEPWDYTQETEPIDNELQKKLYEGFFRSWYGKPELGGFMIWEWAPGDGGTGDVEQQRGYTPENKPAEEVLKKWLAKGPWKVN